MLTLSRKEENPKAFCIIIEVFLRFSLPIHPVKYMEIVRDVWQEINTATYLSKLKHTIYNS